MRIRLYNTDVINSIVKKLIVHSPVGKLVQYNMSLFFFLLLFSQNEDVPLVEFMYLAFTRMPGESYRRRLRSFSLYLCYLFRVLINFPVC